jgi:hypothetical protein
VVMEAISGEKKNMKMETTIMATMTCKLSKQCTLETFVLENHN